MGELELTDGQQMEPQRARMDSSMEEKTMSDDKSKRGGGDGDWVAGGETYEVDYFGASTGSAARKPNGSPRRLGTISKNSTKQRPS